jgi:hypothetical protein
MKFKTNIKCDGCIATVTPILDHAVGAGNHGRYGQNGLE